MTLSLPAAEESLGGLTHPAGLPEGWTLARLRDGLVIDVRSGFACGENNRDGRGVPQLRPMNVTESGQIDLSNLKYVPESKVDRAERWLREGDVVFNNTNSPELVGKTACYRDSVPRAFSNHMTRIRCRGDALNPDYCALALHHMWQLGYFRSICNNHVSQASVNTEVLLDTVIPLPPLAEQQRVIAQVLTLSDSVGSIRTRLENASSVLRRLRQSVLAAACSGRLTADWRSDNSEVLTGQALLKSVLARRRRKWETDNGTTAPTSGKSHKSMRKYKEPLASESGPDDIPETWCWATVDLLTALVTKGSSPNWQGFDYVKEGKTFIRSQNVRLGHLDLEDLAFLPPAFNERHSTSIIHEGDVLLNLVGASVGRSAIATEAIDGANCNQAVGIIRLLEDGMINRFLMYFFLSPQGQRHITDNKADVARANFNLDDIRITPVPLPPYAEQVKIVRRVEVLFKLADTIEQRVEAATARVDKLTQAILAKAFRGELVPTEAELARREGRDYEPASVLLERIQAERATHERVPKVRKKASRLQPSLIAAESDSE